MMKKHWKLALVVMWLIFGMWLWHATYPDRKQRERDAIRSRAYDEQRAYEADIGNPPAAEGVDDGFR